LVALLLLAVALLTSIAIGSRSRRQLRQKLTELKVGQAEIARTIARLTPAADLTRPHQAAAAAGDRLQTSATQHLAGAPAAEKPVNRVRALLLAAVAVLVEAEAAIEGVQVDRDFGAVDGAVAIRTTIDNASRALRTMLDDPDPRSGLTTLLLGGQLHSVLTLADFLDGYLSDRVSWQPLRIACRSAQTTLVLLLTHAGIEIVLSELLTIVHVNDLPGTPAPDRRALRDIPFVQRTAARLARTLQDDECLIVDCHAPGWKSEDIGYRAPSFTIFDRSSWA
jgi:hypothetical protein